MNLQQLICIFLYLCAAGVLFLTLLNRVLILMRERWYKTSFIVLMFLLFCIGAMLAGCTLPLNPWALIPVLILAGMLLGEVGRLRIRRRCAGSPPIDTIPHKINLRKPITTTDLVCHRYQIDLPRWSGSRLRIAHLSDLHVNDYLGAEYFHEVFSSVEEENPDIVLYSGDFVANRKSLRLLKDVVRPMGRFGSYAVLGNHDYWSDEKEVGRILIDNGLKLLVNESSSIDCLGGRIKLTGCDYPWGIGTNKIPASDAESLHLVLSHTPDNIYWMSEMTPDCVFSGHCHAGQARIPVLGSIIVPSIYGRRFDHGHFVVNGTHLFVVSGVGAANPPLRVFCQPDVFIVDICSCIRG